MNKLDQLKKQRDAVRRKRENLERLEFNLNQKIERLERFPTSTSKEKE